MARRNPFDYAFNSVLCLLKPHLLGIYSLILVLSTRITVLFLISLLLLWGCNSKLSHEQYVKWIKDYDNKVHAKKMVSDFVFDVQHQPAEYVLLQRGIQNYPEHTRSQELKR